jgi:tetratricopeptide (TPR) repeat protein
MAVWGVPAAHEDDAERAVRAGLDLVAAVHIMGPGVEARAAILTGEVAVTIGATDQGMVAGDLVNTASRLQSVAPAGTVLVGEATQRAASAGVVFEPAGDHLLKGKSAPVAAWQAVRVAGGIRGRWRTDGPEAPFVGRHDELALLKDQYHATGREKRARLVSVVGPAGIGKSRLSREFLSHIDAEADDFWFHHGRSPAYGEGLTFWALGEMVRQRAGLAEIDDEATTRNRIRAMVAEHITDEADRRWIEPAMLSLLGLGDGSLGTDELFGAWRTFFERMSDGSTVALVFEDLHWADSGLLDFIDYLLEWSRSKPIFILTLARPELLEKRPTWGAGKRQFTSLYLEPLPDTAIRELLTGLVPGLPEAAARAITARADGIPLYAVETVRMLVADGRLAEQDGVYQPTGDLSALAVPESLTALIASRLDALEPDARSVAQDASVLGQRFTLAGLSAVSGLDRSSLEPRLETLLRRELLSLETDPRSPERNQYGFVQSLIREVTYNTLARKDRKTRHLAAARFFESLETDELAGALAGQYLAAHANAEGPDETAALAAQARVALRAAADRALGLGATDQAYEFSLQALALALDPADEAELSLRAGQAASAAGHYADAEPLLRTAMEKFTALEDHAALDRAVTALATNYVDAQRYSDAVELLLPLLGNAADFSARPSLIAAGAQLSRASMLRLEFDSAVAAADRVLPAAEHADLGSIVADLLVTKGTALTMAHRTHEGLALIHAGRELGESLGANLVVLRAITNQAFAMEWISPREGFEATRAGVALAGRVGHRSSFQILAYNAVVGALSLGEWAWADRVLDDLLDENLDEADRKMGAVVAASFRALRGEPRKELVDYLRGVDRTEMTVQAMVDTVVAYDSMSDGRYADAIGHFRAGDWGQGASDNLLMAAHLAAWTHDQATLEELSARVRQIGHHGATAEALLLTIEGALAALRGSTGEALATYGRAIEAWRALGVRFHEALTGLDIASLLDRANPDVQAAVANSRAILTQLGARPFLERLEAEAAFGSPPETAQADALPVTESEVATG